MDKRIVIIGAGPCGLAAAHRLKELGHDNYVVYERTSRVGGLSKSYYDKAGYTWDFAVHVFHSHYPYIDDLIKKLLPSGFVEPTRKSWVRMYDRWVPYPFQYNFGHLPDGVVQKCLQGLEAIVKGEQEMPRDFYHWIVRHFGAGIAKHFMLPYNEKIWSVNPEMMGVGWLGDRVPTLDVQRVIQNVKECRDDVNWGPNARFIFPKKGGTGSIFDALAARVPVDRVHVEKDVLRVDAARKLVHFADGSTDHYDALISTMPLNVLCRQMDDSDLISHSEKLRYTHTYVSCLGYEQPIPTELRDKSWVYCPEKTSCFYRVTPFSNFSTAHAPSSSHCSFMCEISRPDSDSVLEPAHFMETAVDGMTALFPWLKKEHIAQKTSLCAEYGYPVPTLDRDDVLEKILPALEGQSIFSRGRFGAWKYEVGNMDHSMMQGVEAVEHILNGKPERTWCCPNEVN